IHIYGADYFKPLFERFNDALSNSTTIIIVGYGFKDSEINKCISNFLHSTSTKIFVIDIMNRIPKTMQSNNLYFLQGGVENFDLDRLLSGTEMS
ncbi:MAG TPA: hypothetical protein VLG45_06200, partial [Thermodesulfobacteriota bacterium]|nr:hypothetical protein [Thermodesulfobacteriota bacterium]